MDTPFNPALVQLTQRLQEASLGGGPVDPAVLLGKAGDLLSSAEATTQYSSSESSSAADNLNCPIDSSSLLESYSGANAARPSEGPRQASATSQEGKAQICFDFTKGVCSRGDKCKYSHDLATIVHFNSKEKGICFDYLRNQCHRGLLCRFSHDLSNIAQQCQVYNNGAKENKGTKPNAICYDFVKGVCQRGSECRYSHDLSLIARMARGGSAQPKAGEVCYDYLRGRCNRGATCKYSHNIAFLAAPGFLGSALSSDGAPMAAQAAGAGMPGAGAPLAGLPLAGGPGFVGMGGLPGMGPRLATSLSADQATLNHVLAAAGPGAMNQMLAAQAAMHQSSGLAAAAAEAAAAAAAEGRRRSASMNGEAGNDTLLVNDQPAGPWTGLSTAPKALAAAQQAALMTNFAAHHQRMAQAAAAANMQAFGQIAHMGMQAASAAAAANGSTGGDGLLGPAASGMFGKASAMGQFNGVPDAGNQGMRRPPLPPGQMPAELAALLAGGVPENPSLFAETLAAAAKAQAQSQNARIMAAAAAVGASNGSMVQTSSGLLPSMGSGGVISSHGPAVPQPIPGRENMMVPQAYDVGSNSAYSGGSFPVSGNSQSSGGASGENGHLSRSAPSSGPLNPVTVNPDLLPMIKEIWSKPGAA
ncbi:hypothetical protein PLESTB_001085100 [Pleodorina starrii]|uniref:C3H1-type domain-containing protein n=1 Tax=Pleodorina starrii TaxID=330485 RepID=A0A9W6BQV9_9CHLO|nr:hypothetical protein PLESTM_000700900 [Pleodorina starrii]GLC56255.1 hypothetical protein PLESTB_001085100 [Pleodorina starrii]GLC70319.1 hypothetical protein PLESTF_000959100 [Pleodorina starrii]